MNEDEIIKFINSFALKKGQNKDWILHTKDIVIDAKIWREFKRKNLKEV